MLFLGLGLVVGLVLSRRLDPFRSRYFWLGGGLAGILFAPHLWWQRAHDWPTLEFIRNASLSKNVVLAPFDFLVGQLLRTGPFQACIWLAGLVALCVVARFRPWRAVGYSYFAILAVMLSTAAKPYYLAPAYPVLWAAGAVAIEMWTRGRRGSVVVRSAIVALILASGAALAPLARPILPVETYVRYAARLGRSPGTDERKEVGRLPQFFADMQEWRGLAEAVARATAKLSPEERALACVFGQNYGEASAVEYFAPALGLPPAFSGHNNWFFWGIGRCATAPALVVIGSDRERLDGLFEEIELGATRDCRDCMPYEDELPIWIVRRPRIDLASVWPKIKHFD
jgi:hypothetical protein